ncbi:L,D-transpeptidase catalytic domain [Noviherbaspirillum humi]|uniref:L,D-transpeptidase catalytic domain n=1 Tax=Noviherbaspirillum humi TaxID=1688639 RepID=A0A239DKN4_9BURK|nr:L,D-transpeptidase catalytic domain [Noviherbaspirillum humi]
MLIEVYKELAANRLASAQARAEALVNAYPNFHLGQLIYGDLLQMHTRPVDTLGAVGNAPAERLADLREEAMVRLRSLRERPAPDLMPRPLLQLRDDQKHALVVDAKRSRLYVYENRGGELKFVSDYYISQGKLGVNKLKEGDQKTPVGVYYITRRLPGVRLPDFYGPGALPINYPNEWDRLNGRSGSGIWLHGTPSDSYSRPPLSSDGCVVLTNPDLKKLTASVEIGKTPVVIAENIEFVNRAKWASERELAAGLVDQWRRDLEGQDAGKLALHYSSQFKSDRGEDFAGWYARKQLPAFNPRGFSVKLRDATHFLYPGRGDMIVSTFTQEVTAGKFRHTARKRQYWSREGGQWRIVHEAEI